jgi:isopenicillin-N N-acyltransferase like protein
MQTIQLTGNHYTMGLQHARQVYEKRPLISRVIEKRLQNLERLPMDVRPYAAELLELWKEYDPQILSMLRGIADGLELPWEKYFSYSIAAYLAERAGFPEPGQGCTAWAASGDFTWDGAPLLVKNRDYRPDHWQLQYLAHARPAEGYTYSYITSAGSPGVFSSGMNEKGLAVADTHVAATDMGGGLACYSAMMKLLERFSRVPEALECLQSIPHLGSATIVLADTDGEMAVFEAGHRQKGIVQAVDGYVVTTNHYNSPELKEHWLDISPAHLKGNTHRRQTVVREALDSARGGVDVHWSYDLMCSHQNAMQALCRHQEYELDSITLSTVLYLPSSKEIHITDGLPCRTVLEPERVGGGLIVVDR